MQLGSLLAAVALMPLLGGCILAPKVPELALEIPLHYRAAPKNAEAAPPKLDWWRGFRSPELTALIEEAQVANFDIAAAVARIVQADAQSRIAGAPLLPTVDADLSAQRSRSSQATGLGTSSTGVRSERVLYRAALSASYEIDFWGKNRATLQAAEQLAIASRFDREVVALTTIATVANTYFLALAAQDRLRIAREDLQSATRVLDLIKQRETAGTASALDVAQQETLVAVQRAAIPPLEQQLRQNIATLGLLIGRAPEHVIVRGGSMSRLAIPRVTPGLPSELLTRRPDIREAEAQLAGANASVYAARAALLPSIQLTGEGGFQSLALKTLFRPEAAFYSIAAGLTQPIFHGGQLLGQLQLQKGRQDELLQNYRRAIISGFTDVERALVAAQQLAQQERLQRDAVTSSRRAYELSVSRLREGTVDLVTVLQTQIALFQAQDALAVVRLQRLQAAVGLFQALGGGWGPENPPLVAQEKSRPLKLTSHQAIAPPL
jgi:NodT family efflux transporter outer membrane factor (OMF) lipoprotein